MRRITVLAIIFSLVMLFTSTCFAADNPFKGLTQDQVVQKYFEGRQIDLIEGVWLDDSLRTWIAIRSSLVDSSKKYGDYDYLMIEYSTSPNVYIDGLVKTQYASAFKYKRSHLMILSQYSLNYNLGMSNVFFTRIYPNEVSK